MGLVQEVKNRRQRRKEKEKKERRKGGEKDGIINLLIIFSLYVFIFNWIVKHCDIFKHLMIKK
jgi:hypothetical protein